MVDKRFGYVRGEHCAGESLSLESISMSAASVKLTLA